MKHFKHYFSLFFIAFFLITCGKERIISSQDPAEQNSSTALFINDGNKLTKINPVDSKILWQKGDFSFRKHFISVDTSDGSCWIASLNPVKQTSSVYKFDSGGDIIKTVPDFHVIQGISVNSNNGNCAIIDSVNKDTSHLVILDKNGAQLSSKKSISGVPFYNLFDNSIWVTGLDSLDNHWICFYSSSGEKLKQFSGFDGCCDIAFDYSRKKAWLAISGTPGALNIIDFEGNLVFEKTVGGQKGFTDVQAVAVDQNDGSGWIVDAGNKRVVKVSDDGQEVAIVSDVGFSIAASVYHKNKGCFLAAFDLDKLIILNTNGDLLNSISVSKPLSLCLARYRIK